MVNTKYISSRWLKTEWSLVLRTRENADVLNALMKYRSI